MTEIVTAFLLIAGTAAFVIAGIRIGRSGKGGLDEFLVARNSFNTRTGIATLLASIFGAWILFSPAEAATWGGVTALLGYAIGIAAPRLLLIPLGAKMRRALPHGRSLVDFVRVRYGTGLYVAVLLVMLSYLAVLIAAEATATVRLVQAVSDLPAWLPAALALGGSVAYTAIGGLRASIMTDRAQFAIIMPFIVAILLVGGYALVNAGGVAALSVEVPELITIGGIGAMEMAGALILALLFTGIFHQGTWQRVFALESERAVKRSMGWSALVAAPVVLLVGAFGIAHELLGLDQPSAAVFAVLETAVPSWLLAILAIFAVALVLSSMDTALGGIASLTIVVTRTARADIDPVRLRRYALLAMLAVSAGALVVAIQGYSVLYLFLLADLLCAAAAVPVFAGLYIRRYGARLAGASMAVALAAGVALFPDPEFTRGNLFLSFAVAAGIPFLMLPLCLLSRGRFDFARLEAEVRPYND